MCWRFSDLFDNHLFRPFLALYYVTSLFEFYCLSIVGYFKALDELSGYGVDMKMVFGRGENFYFYCSRM